MFKNKKKTGTHWKLTESKLSADNESELFRTGLDSDIIKFAAPEAKRQVGK